MDEAGLRKKLRSLDKPGQLIHMTREEYNWFMEHAKPSCIHPQPATSPEPKLSSLEQTQRHIWRLLPMPEPTTPPSPKPSDASSNGDSKQAKIEAALRYDQGKIRYDLIPADALEALAAVYTAGAAKYSERNWEKGMSWSRCFGSLMRHAWAFWRGEVIDAETGCHHMAMAAWNCFALFSYHKRTVGTDDRPIY